MNPLLQSDKKLLGYNITWPAPDSPDAKAGEVTVRVVCKTCDQAWDIDLEPDDTMDKGTRNSLGQHSEAHGGKFNRMRRVQS